jgi:signal transduction histidine kinase
MSDRYAISARWLLPVALLTLLVVPGLVGLGAWLYEGQRQQDDLQRRLREASAWIRAHVDPDSASVPRAGLQRRLDQLALRAQLTLIEDDRRSSLYTSSDLVDPLVVMKQNEADQAGKSGRAPPITDATSSEPHASITVSHGSSKQGAVVIADLYFTPLDRTFRALLAIASGASALLIVLALAVWLAGRWIVRPLRLLSLQVDRIAGGEPVLASTPSRVREIATVSAALQDMAAALERGGERDARVEEARRFLVTAVAHDLRTPLFSLRGYLEAIVQDIGDADAHLPRAQAKAAQLDRLVGSLFAYARGEYVEDAPSLEAADLGELVRATLADFEPAMLPSGLTFHATGDDGVLALVDRDRLERVLGNLIDNAVRYSRAGGSIEAAWELRDGWAYATIADDGPGIAVADLPRIFDPAYRSDDSRNSHTGGAGLGLTIAKRLIETQGGTLDAHNREQGGALFILRLPTPASAADGASDDQRVTAGPQDPG